MQKIVLITDFTPTADNINGPSALCYYIFKTLSSEYEVYIYSTNSNKVCGKMLEISKKTFGKKLHIIPRSLWMKILIWEKTSWLFSLFYPSNMPKLGRYKLPKRIVKYITKLRPDLIVVYPMSMIGPLIQLKKLNTLVIGPDCFSLHYIRALKTPYYYKEEKLEYAIERIKYETYLAKIVDKYAKSVALVGREDCVLYNTITNGSKAVFLPHPHYSLVEKSIDFNKQRLKVIITGNYNEYTDVDVDIMVTHLIEEASKLQVFDFTFLGKSWKTIVNHLKPYLAVEHKTWVDNYVEELKDYDIQIFPICIGSGTKGKVLDAASNGLLCIGSYYAFENIAIKPNESCILYYHASEIPKILENVFQNNQKYQDFAIRSRESVRKFHDVNVAVEQIKGILKGEKSIIDDRKYLYKNE